MSCIKLKHSEYNTISNKEGQSKFPFAQGHIWYEFKLLQR